MSKVYRCLFVFFAAVGALSLSTTRASAAAFPLSQYDLVVLGNLNSTSEVEGNAWIGGNLGGSASNYATKLTAVSASTVTLSVGGNITATANVNHGSATVGGSVSGHVNLNQSGATLSTAPLDITGMTQALDDASNTFKALTTNSSVTLPGTQPGPVNFNIASSVTQAVFSVNASDIFGNNKVQQINLNNDAASVKSIIINVIGTSVSDIGGGNFVGDFTSATTDAKIVWNFYQATSITVNNAFYGALLAPSAALSNASVINGAVGVASFTQNAEVHLPLSTVSVPEPALCSVMVFGAMTLMRRRA